jgi:hypothetical protein
MPLNSPYQRISADSAADLRQDDSMSVVSRQTRKQLALVALLVGGAFFGIASVSTDRSGASRWIVAAVISGMAAMAAMKFVPAESRSSNEWWQPLPFVLIGLIAVIDGINAMRGAELLADWAIGVWSLPFGLLVLGSEFVDFRRPRADHA